ncbi:OmpA/MotB family protein [Desulfatibacillum alkenivorans]|uniref:OmpA/MotB family protein n=1 Tax=Desulfatibacillum alkenivorans TaxID=259354 RepID=UPI001480C333|nr:OmpA family protein [Desulfatibacillum alkenivorans]
MIFILACVVLIMKLTKMNEEMAQRRVEVERVIQEIQGINALREEMLQEIKAELAAKGIAVEITENSSVLRVPDDQLYFRTMSYEIPKEKLTLVEEIGRVLHDALIKDDRFTHVDTVFIEGHTDSRRAGGLAMGNWGLSTYRAIAVWKYWSEETDYGPGLLEMKNMQGQNMFSVSGYAATRRVELEEVCEDSFRRNRRIDLRFSMRKPVVSDYQGVIDLLGGEKANVQDQAS